MVIGLLYPNFASSEPSTSLPKTSQCVQVLKRMGISSVMLLLGGGMLLMTNDMYELSIPSLDENRLNDLLRNNKGISIESIFASYLGIADLYEFSPRGLLNEVFSTQKIIKLNELKKLAQEMRFRHRGNEYFSTTTLRPTAHFRIRELIYLLEKRGKSELNLAELNAYVVTRMSNLLKSRDVGEWYMIRSIHNPRIVNNHAEPVILNGEQQEKIDLLFKNPSPMSDFPLLASEKKMIKDFPITMINIQELRALRKSTELFEKFTYLKDDASGCLMGNLRAELGGGKQQTCTDETATYKFFVKKIKERGFLANLDFVREISREDNVHSGHQALLLVFSSGLRLVLDSWHEHGGNAAHIVTESDWKKGNDFNDVLRLIP